MRPDVIEGREAKKEGGKGEGLDGRREGKGGSQVDAATVEEEKKLESDPPAFPPQTRALEAGTT